jgi:stage II sporulation protein GA (sporulation sigma-E factor processing peptidase)
MEAGVNLYLEIYIDIIFLINLIMNIVLLAIVKMILKYQSSKFRLLLGAGVGALGACILALIPSLNTLVYFLIAYIMICYFMIYITFRGLTLKLRLRAIIMLYISTFFLGGVMNSLYYYTKLGFYFRELIQGRLFQNQSTTYFILTFIVGLAAVSAFIMILQNLRTGGLNLYKTELSYGENSVQIIGLLDTGNSLYDPFYKKPVMIAEFSAIEPLLTVRQSGLLLSMLNTVEGNQNRNSSSLACSLEEEEDQLNIMMIPYHSIGKNNGILPAIVMNRVVIWNGDEKIQSEKVCVAVRSEKLSKGNEYQIILHKDMM